MQTFKPWAASKGRPGASLRMGAPHSPTPMMQPRRKLASKEGKDLHAATATSCPALPPYRHRTPIPSAAPTGSLHMFSQGSKQGTGVNTPCPGAFVQQLSAASPSAGSKRSALSTHPQTGRSTQDKHTAWHTTRGAAPILSAPLQGPWIRRDEEGREKQRGDGEMFKKKRKPLASPPARLPTANTRPPHKPPTTLQPPAKSKFDRLARRALLHSSD